MNWDQNWDCQRVIAQEQEIIKFLTSDSNENNTYFLLRICWMLDWLWKTNHESCCGGVGDLVLNSQYFFYKEIYKTSTAQLKYITLGDSKSQYIYISLRWV